MLNGPYNDLTPYGHFASSVFWISALYINSPAIVVASSYRSRSVNWLFLTVQDHRQQYKIMLLAVKNGWPVNVLTTHEVHSVRLLSALDIPWQVHQHFDWFLTLAVIEGIMLPAIFILLTIVWYKPTEIFYSIKLLSSSMTSCLTMSELVPGPGWIINKWVELTLHLLSL